jgi:hypothetical protein
VFDDVAELARHLEVCDVFEAIFIDELKGVGVSCHSSCIDLVNIDVTC